MPSSANSEIAATRSSSNYLQQLQPDNWRARIIDRCCLAHWVPLAAAPRQGSWPVATLRCLSSRYSPSETLQRSNVKIAELSGLTLLQIPAT
jgi:hypothetical protein